MTGVPVLVSLISVATNKDADKTLKRKFVDGQTAVYVHIQKQPDGSEFITAGFFDRPSRDSSIPVNGDTILKYEIPVKQEADVPGIYNEVPFDDISSAAEARLSFTMRKQKRST